MTCPGLPEAQRNDGQESIPTTANPGAHQQTKKCPSLFENGHPVGIQQYPDQGRR